MSSDSEELPTPASIAKYVKQNVKAQPAMMGMMHEGGQEIVREEDYKGHHVVVRTTYHITVDGTEVTGHIMLTNAGQVQYHGLPNHSFDSAVALAEALIDNFPEDFQKAKRPRASMKEKSMKGHKAMKMAKAQTTKPKQPRKGTAKAKRKSSKPNRK
jgi:hypothetical protein